MHHINNEDVLLGKKDGDKNVTAQLCYERTQKVSVFDPNFITQNNFCHNGKHHSMRVYKGLQHD